MLSVAASALILAILSDSETGSKEVGYVDDNFGL